MMRESTRHDGYRPMPDKRYWHAYGLQFLCPAKFTDAVTKILHGKDLLISTKGGLIDYGNPGLYNTN